MHVSELDSVGDIMRKLCGIYHYETTAVGRLVRQVVLLRKPAIEIATLTPVGVPISDHQIQSTDSTA